MPDKKRNASQPRLRDQVCFPLYSAANAMIRAYRPILEALDLTYLQYIVMMVLWEEDKISVTALGNQLYLDSGTLTPLLKRLEKKQLLKRKTAADDERVKILELTENGEALRQKATDIPEKILCEFDIPPADLKNLKKLCDEIIRASTERKRKLQP